ncbi:MAG TPA: HD domain-containing protein [Steroidobacteraceae bacterium]|nr:HD domain-containing protein [Steroidobacteraceae bacterium]
MYCARGARAYFGESVTTLEHSLQAAHFARKSNASDALVAAALLHDVGHLLAAAPPDLAAWKADARHEVNGARWLAARFGPDVFEPVRLHVPAKRYLCATDPSYEAQLSSASMQTLRLQGGPMSAAEVRAFEAEPHHRAAISLRRWDDSGKVAGLRTPGFADYGALIRALTEQR